MDKIRNTIFRDKNIIQVFIVLFCLMFLLNYLYPLLVDDWDYSFTHFGKRINSFYAIAYHLGHT